MIDLTGYKLTFDDEFNARSISKSGAATTWADVRSEWAFDAYSDIGFGRSSFMDPGSGYDPFAVKDGALTITAKPDSTTYGYPGSWESGLINTKASFSQTYGYFEMRADLSNSVGAWDAFWLLPETQVNTGAAGWQELDVVEHYGANNAGTYSWIHTTDPSSNPNQDRQVYSSSPATTSGYHTYGMLWGPDTIALYVDGVLQGTRQTPSDMHGPMYLLADLAITSDTGATGSPMQTKIDYIRAFSNDASAVAVNQDDVSAPDGRDPGLYGATILRPSVSIRGQKLAADTGASATDKITSNGAVTVWGTVAGPSGTAVQVFDGATALGVAKIARSGIWYLRTTLAAGTHALSAAATDLSGDSAISAVLPGITVSTAPPTIALTAQGVAADGTVTLAGTLSGTPGTSVSVYSGSTLLGAATLDRKGGWSYAARMAPGSYTFAATATDLAGNTASVTPSLAVPDPAAATGGDTLVLNLSEDAYRGDAQFVVSVDGQQVDGTQTVTALHGLGQAQDFTFAGNFGTGPHTVGVTFLNDLYAGTPTTDRNLYVNAITLDGASTTINAAQNGGGLRTYTIMPPAAPSLLSLVLSEDAYQGDAQFTVSVDGQQVGGTQTVTALSSAAQTQTFALTGAFGPGAHVVGINFLNDAYAGTAATDRNLYVRSIALDAATTVTNAAQMSQGMAQYTVSAPTAAGGPTGTPALTIAAGTTLILDRMAAAGTAVAFAGAGGVAQFSDASAFHGSVAGFGQGDLIDLRSIGFGASTSLGYAAAAGSGLLGVTDGSHSAKLALTGQYTVGSFTMAADGQGGTSIAFVAGRA